MSASLLHTLDLSLALPVYLLAAVLGAIMGSFVNCVAWRIVAGESPWSGRSHCTTCGHTLGVLDLVPVLSWAASGGKCRHCGERVSVRYPLTELFMGVVFVCIVARWGLTLNAAAYLAAAVILLGLSLVDLDTMTIPNGFVVALIVVWAAFVGAVAVLTAGGSVESGWVAPVPDSDVAGALASLAGGNALAGTVLDGMLGGVAIGGGMLVISAAFDALLGKRSLGGGDVKLLFAVGLFLGFAVGLLNLVLACVAGLVFGILYNVRKKGEPGAEAAEGSPGAVEGARPRAGAAFPFGPAIAFATVLSLLVGQAAVGWYLGLFL